MICCIVCGFPVPTEYEGDRLTCGDRCLTELKARQESARLRRREKDQIKRKKYQPMNDTIRMVMEHFARIILEQGIPTYTSNTGIDGEICKRDEWLSKLNKVYRRKCVTASIVSCGYTQNSTANGGKKTYRLVENRDTLRAKLADIVGVEE